MARRRISGRSVNGAAHANQRGPMTMVTVEERYELDMSWQADARCRSADPNLFFAPLLTEKPEEKVLREAKAKAICAQCPVQRECLRYAVATREPYGIWGGLNELERRELMARRAG